MIERFQEIKRVGTFKDATQIARCGFNKTTIIFGGNSQGKSTICDILKSLSQNNPDYIEERKTVGETCNPSVKISFGNSKVAQYSNSTWTISSDTPEAHHLVVFDSEFVQKNIFTNSTIERQNKEAFTEFVLGSESIEIQDELLKLRDEKKVLEDRNEVIQLQLKKFMPFSIEELKGISYKEDISYEDTSCLGLKQQIADLQKDKGEIEKIKSLSMPIEISYNDKVLPIYLFINNCLKDEFVFSSEDILKDFEEHKKKFQCNEFDFDSWICEGKKFNSEICPYCGNSLKDNKLVASYLTIFCDKFIKYNDNINSLQKIHYPENSFLSLTKTLSENKTKIDLLSAKIYDENFKNIKDKYLLILNELEALIDNCEKELPTYNDLFLARVVEKLNKKYNEIQPIDIAEIEAKIVSINQKIGIYNTLLNKLVVNASDYLKALSIDSIEQQIKSFNEELLRLSSIVYRNKYDQIIKEYNQNLKEITINIDRSKDLKKAFDDSQAEFLDTFFTDINNYYKRLGSKNYKIEKVSSGQGIKKVVTLKLFFRDKEIENNKIKFVLSDSDKRALALSIFLSKLKSDENISNAIIILDDPITSFDIERMNLFIGILKEFEAANQLIILTHYTDFFRKFVELNYELDPSPSLLKILFMPESNIIEPMAKENNVLLMDNYEQALYKMYSFIEGTSHEYSSNNARILMQKYLEFVFYFPVKENCISHQKFEQFLEELHTVKLIDDNLFIRLNAKREEYNVSSHIFDDETEESKRNSISDLRDLLTSI